MSGNHSSRPLHANHHGNVAHHHAIEGRHPKVLAWSVALTLGFAFVEIATGLWSHSLALISDAGHMVTDSMALTLALLAQFIAKRPPSAKHSFGFGRAEALAAFINGLAMLAVIAWIMSEAIRRFSNPEQVKSEAVVVVALIGLAVNLVVAWLLSRDQKSVNTRAALVHVMGDLLSSVAAIFAGGVIYFTGWVTIAPLLSVLVALLILKSTIGVLRESYHMLMEGVPHHIDYEKVGVDIAAVRAVLSVHDLYIWEMSGGHSALIGHVEIADLQEWPRVLREIQEMLLSKHGIDHVTLQVELPSMAEKEHNRQ